MRAGLYGFWTLQLPEIVFGFRSAPESRSARIEGLRATETFSLADSASKPRLGPFADLDTL